MAMTTDKIPARPISRSLSRADWIDAARFALTQGGVAAVKVDRLADALGVTRGSFYWHFANRDALLSALLEHWEATNTESMERAVAAAAPDGQAQFSAVVRLWIDEVDFSPSYDAAVRDWARHDAEVARTVHRVDDRRIALLVGVFEALGYVGVDAFIHARVAYFHQVGYYALEIHETREVRLALLPHYYRILTGHEMPDYARSTGKVSDEGSARERNTCSNGADPNGTRAR